MRVCVYQFANRVAPASQLDHVLVPAGVTFPTHYYSLDEGQPLVTESDWQGMYQTLVNNAQTQQYPTTDHLIYSIEVNGVRLVFVSLDNSRRANRAGWSVHRRFPAIGKCLKNIVGNDPTTPIIVCFAEACRLTPDDKHQLHSAVPVEWMKTQLGMNLWLSAKNNYFDMDSFGIEVFERNVRRTEVTIQREDLLEGRGKGCAAVVVNFNATGHKAICVHFPLDFEREGDANETGIAMKRLLQLCSEATAHGWVPVAFGDMNTVKGNPLQAVNRVLGSQTQFVLQPAPEYTFFAAYFDTIETTESWGVVGCNT